MSRRLDCDWRLARDLGLCKTKEKMQEPRPLHEDRHWKRRGKLKLHSVQDEVASDRQIGWLGEAAKCTPYKCSGQEQRVLRAILIVANAKALPVRRMASALMEVLQKLSSGISKQARHENQRHQDADHTCPKDRTYTPRYASTISYASAADS